MQYFETELFFTEIPSSGKTGAVQLSKQNTGFNGTKDFIKAPDEEILGIKVRIGNQPLVYNLKKAPVKNATAASADILAKDTHDYYLVVHAIGAARIKGKAKVEELQYFAEAVDPFALKTVDLVPATRFKEVIRAGASLEVGLSITGEALLNIPAELTANLVPQLVNAGGAIQMYLSSSANFAGKFSLSLQLPVVQAIGISSNSCFWVLQPDEHKTPLLGDQLLIQTVMVPKGTKAITYNITGLVKADRGLFWKQQEKTTPQYTITVKLG